MNLVIDRAAIVKLLRTQMDLGQHQLGVNKGTVNLLEKRKRRTDEDSLNKIARHLDTTLREIDDTVEVLNGRLNPASFHVSRYSPEHEELHRKLQIILEADADYAIGIKVNLDAIYEYILTASPGPKGKKFSAMSEILPTHRAIRKDLVKKRRGEEP